MLSDEDLAAIEKKAKTIWSLNPDFDADDAIDSVFDLLDTVRELKAELAEFKRAHRDCRSTLRKQLEAL